jgi:Ca-activated chloride channel family protein
MGGTAIDDALKKALDLGLRTSDLGLRSRPFVVIFLTDGLPTIGTTDETQIVSNVKKENTGQARIFCFGIGTDVNTHLLDKITEETRAVSQYVLPEEDLEVKVSSFFSKIREPVLADPALKFTADVRATKLYPSPLPDLFKGEQLVLLGRYSGQGDSAAILEGMVNGVAKKFTYEVRFAEENSENDFIPRLWATRRVGYLLDEIRLHGENAELRDETAELARKYGIVTPYTAYLIVEEETRRDVPGAARSLQRFYRDREVREEARHNWDQFKTQRDGGAGVGGARYGLALKSATAAGPASASGALEASRALGFDPAAIPSSIASTDSKARLVQYSQQTRFVAGKNFFQNDGQWIDSEVQKHPTAKHVRIQFGSAEYFNLLAKHPKASAWLALGQNVQFVLDNVIYEVYE